MVAILSQPWYVNRYGTLNSKWRLVNGICQLGVMHHSQYITLFEKKLNVFWIKRWVGWVSVLVCCVNITLVYMHCVIVLSWLTAMLCWYRNDNLHMDRVQSGANVFHEQTHIWLKDQSPISILQLLASWCLEYACQTTKLPTNDHYYDIFFNVFKREHVYWYQN